MFQFFFAGGLKFRFFYGWDAEEINDKRIVANGQHHDVIFYRKDDGATLVYKVRVFLNIIQYNELACAEIFIVQKIQI